MTVTTSTRRKWSVSEQYAKLGTYNPRTGRPWSRKSIAEEVGVSVAAVSKAFLEYESTPGAVVHEPDKLLPWPKLPSDRHDDWPARGTCIAVKQERTGVAPTGDDHARLVRFLGMLKLMSGDRDVTTVVAWDYDANQGAGGWVYRPREPWERDGVDIVGGVAARRARARR